MTVKSVNTRNLTKAELIKEENKVKNMTKAQLKKFREGFDADQMGFAGRKEGI